jgi:hypothetical protein
MLRHVRPRLRLGEEIIGNIDETGMLVCSLEETLVGANAWLEEVRPIAVRRPGRSRTRTSGPKSWRRSRRSSVPTRWRMPSACSVMSRPWTRRAWRRGTSASASCSSSTRDGGRPRRPYHRQRAFRRAHQPPLGRHRQGARISLRRRCRTPRTGSATGREARVSSTRSNRTTTSSRTSSSRRSTASTWSSRTTRAFRGSVSPSPTGRSPGQEQVHG